MWWIGLWLACWSGPEPSDEPTIEDQLEALEALGYMTDSEPGATDRVLLNTERAQPGLNLWSSGHASTAYLMDNRGLILHTWTADYPSIFDRKPSGNGWKYFRRIKLLPNGDLLAVYEGKGIVRLDRDSKVIWKFVTRTHHDLDVRDDGTFWVLNRSPKVDDSSGKEVAWLEDRIEKRSLETGKVLRKIPIPTAFEDTAFSRLLTRRRRKGDWMHTNSVTELRDPDAKAPFSAGNLLLSSRAWSALFVIDPESRKVVWTHRGRFRFQHDPQLVAPDRLLLFDNDGGGRKQSKVREFALPDMTEAWSYIGSEVDPFYSRFNGTVQRLDNGNTLVTESSKGRVFEVTPAGDKVWQFSNTHAGITNKDHISWIPEMVRLPPSAADFLKDAPE